MAHCRDANTSLDTRQRRVFAEAGGDVLDCRRARALVGLVDGARPRQLKTAITLIAVEAAAARRLLTSVTRR